MDPIMISLVSGLGTGLVTAVSKLAEKGLVDPALEKGLEPVRGWLTRGYDEQKDAEALRKTLMDALDELNQQHPSGSPERLIATLKLTGLSKVQHTALAAAAIEMTHFDPSCIPDGLLSSLRLDETYRNLLASFLFLLRKHLADNDKYEKAIAYTTELDQRSQLAGITQHFLDLQQQAGRLVSLLEALATERHLTTDDEAALEAYLEWARERWGNLTLPLIRKRSGEITQAKLKQVFVPLLLRDIAAEENTKIAENRRRKAIPPESEVGRQHDSIELGQMLNKYPRFLLLGLPGSGKTTLLHRTALAFAEGRAETDLDWQGRPLLPIFARLRNFGAFLEQHKREYPAPCPGALVAFLENQYREAQRRPISAVFFDQRLLEGGCLVLLDGLDEVSENRVEIAQHITEFITAYGKFPGNRFGLSSRPRGYEMVERQLRPARLATAEVRPLEDEGIRDLSHKLFTLIEPDPVQRENDTRELVNNILARPDLTEIASTPLFCSALVQVFKYHGAHLPERRVDVLDEIVDLLLGFWKAQQSVADAERLAADDGTTRQRRLEDSINVKRQRLSYLAYHMQEKRSITIAANEAVDLLASYLKERERVKDEDTCCQWAEDFLINSHERSGLLAENEPGQYAFLHKAFMEFLTATWLINRGMVVDKAIEHLNDDWWEPVILLAGAHPMLPEMTRSDLVNQVLDVADLEENPFSKANCVNMAGKLATDMRNYLPGPDHERVETYLLSGMTDLSFSARQRADLGVTLARLGDPRPEVMTIEGMEFCFIPAGKFLMGYKKPLREVNLPSFWIAKYPVTNAQYKRFVEAGGYNHKHYWTEAALDGYWQFDPDSHKGRFHGLWGDILGRDHPAPAGYPFDLSNHPVVGVSWYEAQAFSHWLDDLAHGHGWLGDAWMVTLPDEMDWEKAARGGIFLNSPYMIKIMEIPAEEPILKSTINPDPEREYPWIGDFTVDKANTGEVSIGASSAVGCFPGGASPYGAQEMSGNVWEWQKNWHYKNQLKRSLQGGSWQTVEIDATCFTRISIEPDERGSSIGFRCCLSLRL